MANLDKIKISGITYDIIDSTALHTLDDNVTSGGTNAVKGSGIYNAITAATAALAETVGQEMSAKTDNDTFTAYTAATEAVLSGKVDNSTYTAYTAATATELNGKASTSDIVNFFDGAVYEMSGETHVINFYHGDTVKATINAEDFIADGFLSAVTIENRTISGESVPCLVFEWNTAAGIEETVIPLENIFNPDNFYDKTEIDTIVSGINEDISAVSGDVATKQNTLTAGDGIQITNDVISVTGIPNVDQTVISGSTNPVAGGAVYTELQGKQATLVNQTNIKSINNESLLGSGNISTLQASVSGTTLILS